MPSRQQPEDASPGWSHSAGRLALTLAGLVLIALGLQYPLPDSPLTPMVRPSAAASSARGLAVAGRYSGAIEAPLLPASTALDLDSGSPLHMGIGGAVTDLPSLLSLAATFLPTPEPVRTQVITYSVQKGDNVWLIAERFGITQDTVIWANEDLEMDPDLLQIGQELYILPVSGVWHTVIAGDTLAGIADRYKVTVEAITGYAPNGLAELPDLTPGRKLIIPGGIEPFEPRYVQTRLGTITANARPEPGRFIWPCHGYITQYFNKDTHLGLDIANAPGTPIYAANSGTVTAAGSYGTLGIAVCINHGNGYITWYRHLRSLAVSSGLYVHRGQQIGEMGSTGKSTGPHLHFVVNYLGGAVNPWRYLP